MTLFTWVNPEPGVLRLAEDAEITIRMRRPVEPHGDLGYEVYVGNIAAEFGLA